MGQYKLTKFPNLHLIKYLECKLAKIYPLTLRAYYTINIASNIVIDTTYPIFSKILIEYQNAIKTNKNLSKDYFINHKDLEISKTTIFLTEEKYKMDNWELKNIKVKKEEDILFSLLKEGLIRFKLKRISVITSEILARIPLIESEREKKEELNRFSKLTELSRNLHKQVGREC